MGGKHVVIAGLQPSEFTLVCLIMLVFVATAIAAWLPVAQAAAPTTRIVSNVNDSGAGSLRQAILDAADGETITFAPNVSGTIGLSDQLIITKSLTIQGPGVLSLTLDCNLNVRVFNITAAGAQVAIANLTIRHGKQAAAFQDGGGILNAGVLSLTNVVLAGNLATGSGGGFANLGTAILTDVTLSGNAISHYGSGGGLANAGTLTLTNVTFGGNTASIYAGALSNGGSAFLTNVTFSNNSASSGAAIGNGGNLQLQNTLIANSSGGGNCDGALVSLGHNLSDDTTCRLSASGDMTNTAPLLGPLADDGGPTATYALLPGSPAINRGDNLGCPASDQRGIARPQGGVCDIGAYEFAFPHALFLRLIRR